MSATAIRTAREASGKTQVEVAEALGITQQALSHWENGVRQVPSRRLLDLAAALGTSVEDLLAESAA